MRWMVVVMMVVVAMTSRCQCDAEDAAYCVAQCAEMCSKKHDDGGMETAFCRNDCEQKYCSYVVALPRPAEVVDAGHCIDFVCRDAASASDQ